MGNVWNERLEQIWRNRKITEIRKMLIQRTYKAIPICAQCDGTNMSLYRQMQQARQTIYKLYGSKSDILI